MWSAIARAQGTGACSRLSPPVPGPHGGRGRTYRTPPWACSVSSQSDATRKRVRTCRTRSVQLGVGSRHPRPYIVHDVVGHFGTLWCPSSVHRSGAQWARWKPRKRVYLAVPGLAQDCMTRGGMKQGGTRTSRRYLLCISQLVRVQHPSTPHPSTFSEVGPVRHDPTKCLSSVSGQRLRRTKWLGVRTWMSKQTSATTLSTEPCSSKTVANTLDTKRTACSWAKTVNAALSAGRHNVSEDRCPPNHCI